MYRVAVNTNASIAHDDEQVIFTPRFPYIKMDFHLKIFPHSVVKLLWIISTALF